MLKKFLCTALALLVFGLGVWLSVRKVIIYKADARAEELLSGTSVSSAYAISLHATQKLYKSFGHDGYPNHQIFGRLRSYLSSQYLPAFIRIPSGAVELLMMEGWCDDAARALIYTLKHRSVEGKQWNMIGDTRAHSAVIADFGGVEALLDPYYGYHSITKDGPVSPRTATFHHGLIPFDETSNKDFYREYENYAKGVQGEPLTITTILPAYPLGHGKGVILDIKTDKVTPMDGPTLWFVERPVMWRYVGHKYDRNWTRELRTSENVQVIITLTQKPDNGVLRTFSPPPKVDGTKLVWNLLKGQSIISHDGKAGISWKRLNSYIDTNSLFIGPYEGSQGDTP